MNHSMSYHEENATNTKAKINKITQKTPPLHLDKTSKELQV